MSLKAFHIVFVIVSILLMVGMGIWAVGIYNKQGEGAYLALGVVGFVCALAMTGYGRWFLKKLEKAHL